MNGSLYLIGGGEIRTRETADIDHAIQALVDRGSTLVFFGSAAGDSPEYRKAIESEFGEKLTIIAPRRSDGVDYAVAAMRSASIIYLGGGDTRLLLDLFKEWDLLEELKEALGRGVHVVGMSAGAEALSTWYFHEHEDKMELRRGWGFVAASVLVHATETSVARAESMWHTSPDAKTTTFLGIGERAAWRVNTTGIQSVGSGNTWKFDTEANPL